jgi:hypothetical protein
MHTLVLAMASGTLTFVDAALGIAIAAALAMLTSIAMRRRHETWVANAALTEGKVVRVRESGDVDTVTEYTPVIVYHVDGHEFSIDGKRSTERKFEVGARVTVAYEPRLPASARVATIHEPTTHDRIMRLFMFALVALIVTVASALLRT